MPESLSAPHRTRNGVLRTLVGILVLGALVAGLAAWRLGGSAKNVKGEDFKFPKPTPRFDHKNQGKKGKKAAAEGAPAEGAAPAAPAEAAPAPAEAKPAAE